MTQATQDGIEQIKAYKSAYEKMLEDGTAFKEVDMHIHTEPDVAIAEGKREPITAQPSQPIGDRIQDDRGYEVNNDYTEFDNVMEQRIQRLRNKMKGKTDGGGTNGTVTIPIKEFNSLKNRVKKLEEAMMLIMETHERILS